MTLAFNRLGDILIVTVGGTVTLERLLRIRAAWREEWMREPVKATVGDYRGADMALSPAEWELAFTASVRWLMKGCAPAATVVRPECFDEFQACSVRWASHGFIRATFTSLPAAVAWAQCRRETPHLAHS